MRALVPVNRTLCLGGVPGLRRVPLLNRLPGVRGLTDIVAIDFPAADEERLRACVKPDTAVFITPNHPEFFTDWMLDKEVQARVAPLAASWATHTVVNGLGKAAQKFWLKNNLIAQIPGAAGAEARAYSVAWALKGHGVLLHPEGLVGWHGDTVAPLFPGAVEMAAEAALKARTEGRSVTALVAPVVWKLKFVADAGPALAAEMAYVERKLELAAPAAGSELAQRVHAAYRTLFQRDAKRLGIAAEGLSLARLHGEVLRAIVDRIAGHIGDAVPAGLPDARAVLLAAERWLRRDEARAQISFATVRALAADLRLMRRFSPALYPAATITQEQVAENIKRLRNDYCRGRLKDTLNGFLPRPAGSRRAIIRVPEPIDVSRLLGPRGALDEGEAVRIADELRRRMQASLDAINRALDGEGGVIRTPNPFRD